MNRAIVEKKDESKVYVGSEPVITVAARHFIESPNRSSEYIKAVDITVSEALAAVREEVEGLGNAVNTQHHSIRYGLLESHQPSFNKLEIKKMKGGKRKRNSRFSKKTSRFEEFMKRLFSS